MSRKSVQRFCDYDMQQVSNLPRVCSVWGRRRASRAVWRAWSGPTDRGRRIMSDTVTWHIW